MATYAELEYLRRQKAKKEGNIAMGVQPINQGDTNEGELSPWVSFTQEEQGTKPVSYQEEQPASWIEQAAGKVEDFLYSGVKGIFSFFEGVGDFIGTGLAAFGDATGWYETQGLKDYLAQDISGKLSQTLKSSGLFMPGLMPGQYIKNLAEGNYFKQDFWQDIGQGFANSWDSDVQDNNYLAEKYDLKGDIETPGGQFAANVFESIGRMLPAIALTVATGGGAAGTLTDAGAKFMTTLAMSTSAAGSASAEALGEGASSGQALAYGLASGVVEGATEYIPWVGGNTIPGLNVGKMTAGSLLKSAFEEGMEEVVSGLFDPALKAIYKGPEEFERYTNPDKWADEFSRLGQEFLAGFASGGVMSGTQLVGNVVKAGGVKQYNSLVKLDMSEALMGQTYDNLKSGKITTSQAISELDSIRNQRASLINEMNEKYGYDFLKKIGAKSAPTEIDYQKIIEEQADPKSYDVYLQEFKSNQIQEAINAFGEGGRQILNGLITNELTNKTGKTIIAGIGTEGQFSDSTQALHIKVTQNGEIEAVVINPKYSDQFSGLLGHEVLVHSLLDTNPDVRNALIEKIKKIDTNFSKGDEWVKANYSRFYFEGQELQFVENVNDDISKWRTSSGETIAVNNARVVKVLPSADLFASEQLANYIEGKMSTAKGVMQLIDGKVGLLDILKTMFKKGQGFANVRLQLAIANAIRALNSAEAVADARPAMQASKVKTDEIYVNEQTGEYDTEDLKKIWDNTEAISKNPDSDFYNQPILISNTSPDLEPELGSKIEDFYDQFGYGNYYEIITDGSSAGKKTRKTTNIVYSDNPLYAEDFFEKVTASDIMDSVFPFEDLKYASYGKVNRILLQSKTPIEAIFAIEDLYEKEMGYGAGSESYFASLMLFDWLGYDCYIDEKNGIIAVSALGQEGVQIYDIDGERYEDWKRGEPLGKLGDLRRQERQAAFQSLDYLRRRYVDKESRGINNLAEEQEYISLIRKHIDETTVTRETVADDGEIITTHFVKEQYWTRRLKAIGEVLRGYGYEPYFTLDNYYIRSISPSAVGLHIRSLYQVYFSPSENMYVEEIARHELNHALFASLPNEIKNKLFEKLEKKKKVDYDLALFFSTFEDRWSNYAKNETLPRRLLEELACEIYSESFKMNDRKFQKEFIEDVNTALGTASMVSKATDRAIRYSKSKASQDLTKVAEQTKTLNQVIEGYQNTVDYYKEELSITKQEAKDMERALKAEFAEEAKDLKNYTKLAQKLVMAHMNSKIHAEGIVEVPTDAESIANNAEKIALVPFSQSGVMKDGKLQLSKFTPAIRALAEVYSPEQFGGLYNQGIALTLNNMYQWDDSGSASTEQENAVLALYKAIRKLGGENMRKIELDRIQQAAEADYGLEAVGAYKDTNIFARNAQKLISIVSDPRASADMYFSEASLVGEKLINEGSKQAGFAKAYEFEAQQKIAKIQKELELNKKAENVTVGGVSMPFLAALEWRLMLSMDENTKEFKNANVGYAFENKKTGKPVKVDYSDSVMQDLKNAISDEYLEKAKKLIVDDYYGKFIYDKVAEVYKRATDMEYGELMPRGNYMRLSTMQLRSSLLTPTVEGAPSISNLMQRNARSGYIKMGGGLFAKMTETARMTAYETFLQPLATEVDHMLNTLDNNGNTLLSKMGTTKEQFVKWYIRELTGGIKPEATGAFGQAMTTMVLANFKIGPIQTLSAFTSGLSVTEQFNPRLMKNAMKPEGKYKTALDNLFELVPEAKYRGESNDVYYGNVGDVSDNAFSQGMKKIGQFISKVTGTNQFDKATVRYILLSAMNTQAKAMNRSIDDVEVAKAVEERARQLYMTQISNNSKHFSPAQMVSNPYGKTTGGQAVLMRMVKAFGGAAKAFTNFFNRSVLRLIRMNQTGKWLKQHTDIEYDEAIFKANNDMVAAKNEVAELTAKYEEAVDKRIEARDNREKGPRKTQAWKNAQAEVRRLKSELAEASKKQGNKAEVERLTKELNEAKANAKSLTSGYLAESQRAYEQAKAAEESLKKQVAEAKHRLRLAENSLAEAKGHMAYYEKAKASYEDWTKNNKGGKTVATLIAGMILAGVGKEVLDLLYDLLLKRKEPKDLLNVQDITLETLVNSTMNLYPGLRTITGVFQGYEAADPTMKTINLLVDSAQSVQKFAENQTEGNGKAVKRNGLQLASLVSGVPFKTMYDQINGILGWANPEAALAMKNVFYQVSSTSTAKYNSAIESNDRRSAESYLNYIFEERIGEVGSSTKEELINLSIAGESVLPSAIPTSYTVDGENVTISWTNQQEAKRYYSRANGQVAKAIASSEYKKLNAAQKAQVIRSIYTAYKNASLSKALGSEYKSVNLQSTLAKVNDPKIGAMTTALVYIRNLEATKTKTKKELAVAYVNRLALNKGEKLIVLKMAGYSVDSKSLVSALRAKGLTKKEAEAFAS